MPIRLSHISLNARRGSGMFTMVIFIMLLISVALMYYYFQRTRSLERDLADIQARTTDTADTSATIDAAPPAAPVSTEQTAAAPAPPPAASTPEATGAAPVSTEMPASDTLPPSQETVLPPAESDTLTPADEAAGGENAPAEETPAATEPIKSVYDLNTPSVKVRAPRRSER